MNNQHIEEFFTHFSTSVQRKTCIKLTLSRYKGTEELKNIYIKPVTIKNKELFSFVYRYNTKDITKNYDHKHSTYLLKNIIGKEFFTVTLFTEDNDIQLEINTHNATQLRKSPPSQKKDRNQNHNKHKNYRIESSASFLYELGVTTEQGVIKADMYDKYRQINKFIEIVDAVYTSSPIQQKKTLNIIDFGSGKSYLTFAIYYYFSVLQKKEVNVVGVEVRQDMVQKSNEAAQKLHYTQLTFVESTIQDYSFAKEIDMVVALHACDTATDDAIIKGIQAHAQLILLAPCCHKYVRKHMSRPEERKEILKYGILEQRESEILTDGLRALTLEYFGYKTNVLEFISQEYTSKNLMITAVKKSAELQATKLQNIAYLKKQYSLHDYYLDKKII